MVTPFCQSKSIRVTGVKREIFPASSFWTCNCFLWKEKRLKSGWNRHFDLGSWFEIYKKKLGVRPLTSKIGGVELSLIFWYDSRSLLWNITNPRKKSKRIPPLKSRNVPWKGTVLRRGYFQGICSFSGVGISPENLRGTACCLIKQSTIFWDVLS